MPRVISIRTCNCGAYVYCSGDGDDCSGEGNAQRWILYDVVRFNQNLEKGLVQYCNYTLMTISLFVALLTIPFMHYDNLALA